MPFVIPMLYRWLAGAVAVILLALALVAWDSARIKRAEKRGGDAVRAEWTAERERLKDAAIAQAVKNAAETERRLQAQKEAQDAHDKELARLRTDTAAARGAAERLRQQLALFTAGQRPTAGDPAPAGDGPPAAAALDLLAQLFSRADDEAGILAEFADAAAAAGRQCVRSYEALKP